MIGDLLNPPRGARPSQQAGPPRSLRLIGVVLAALLALPLLYLLLRAAEMGPSDLAAILLRPRTVDALWNSVRLAAATTLTTTLIAVPAAWLTTRTDLPARRLWLILLVLPLVFPSFVGGYVVVSALGPRGMMQGWLETLFGIQRLPEIYGFPGALLTMTLFTYPYTLLSVRAALQGLDPALEESARSLGLTAWQSFFRLTMPLLRPAIVAGGLLVALYTLSDFGAVSLLQYDALPRVILVQLTASLNRGGAAILSLLLAIVTLIVLIFEARSAARTRYYSVGSGAKRRHSRVALGKWRGIALTFCATVVGWALVMPLAVLLFWLIRGLRAGEPMRALWSLTANSLYASGLAALATTLVALPIAFLVVRYPSLLSRVVGRVAYMGYGLPGIVVALALISFGATYATPLYQTLVMLVFAYVVRFLPQALGTVESALQQLSPRVEDAARSLGYGPLQVLGRVTLPLARNGIASAAALIFLTTMKELPATLFLSPLGFRTLATRIWDTTSEGFFAQGAAPALVLVFFSAFSLLPILVATRER
ncbi:MAG: iron ABC transporter permease [Ardenticatenales bacterium]|nr:iron ABC transporter permease [Ardenticatenales bacterium]MCB9171918.1 iron ABC transporter permease [Ardenticatenales bacterium]